MAQTAALDLLARLPAVSLLRCWNANPEGATKNGADKIDTVKRDAKKHLSCSLAQYQSRENFGTWQARLLSTSRPDGHASSCLLYPGVGHTRYQDIGAVDGHTRPTTTCETRLHPRAAQQSVPYCPCSLPLPETFSYIHSRFHTPKQPAFLMLLHSFGRLFPTPKQLQ